MGPRVPWVPQRCSCPCHDQLESAVCHNLTKKNRCGLKTSLWPRDEGLHRCLAVPPRCRVAGDASQRGDVLESCRNTAWSRAKRRQRCGRPPSPCRFIPPASGQTAFQERAWITPGQGSSSSAGIKNPASTQGERFHRWRPAPLQAMLPIRGAQSHPAPGIPPHAWDPTPCPGSYPVPRIPPRARDPTPRLGSHPVPRIPPRAWDPTPRPGSHPVGLLQVTSAEHHPGELVPGAAQAVTSTQETPNKQQASPFSFSCPKILRF